jgi:hypothetical protein
LNKSLKHWLGQVTTGHGIMVLIPTLLAALSGTMSWRDAAPLLVAAVIGVIWPENAALKTDVQALATDVADLVAPEARKSGAGGPGA